MSSLVCAQQLACSWCSTVLCLLHACSAVAAVWLWGSAWPSLHASVALEGCGLVAVVLLVCAKPREEVAENLALLWVRGCFSVGVDVYVLVRLKKFIYVVHGN